MPGLFDPLTIRGVKFANRVFVSPMCQYSSENGYANDWLFVHLGIRAIGAAGLVLTEATAVLREGRIAHEQGGIACIQGRLPFTNPRFSEKSSSKSKKEYSQS
jgi:2,4-dienoyl-CoA reductase-like NADH-dependent reductase (Old Yellow Enzyme family)